MKSPIEEFNPRMKIETIKSTEGGEVSFSPERGGIITSLKLQGKEVLYFDEDTFHNLGGSVKGGIPILFPNAGPIPDDIKNSELSNLKQHGFAREMKWVAENNADGFTEVLESNADTKKVFPYDFKLSIVCEFEKDGSFAINQLVENLDEKELPVSSGLHPYFNVPNVDKDKIEFNFEGGDFIKENIDKWSNGEYVSIDNPNTPMEIKIPGLGTVILKPSPDYRKIWVWSMPGKDFICVEPVMGDPGEIITNPKLIKPKESFNLSLNISLEASEE